MKPTRKSIESYANMRSCNGNLLEKAISGQVSQSHEIRPLLTKEEKYILEYCLQSCAMSGKYITNSNIDELVSISNKLGLSISRELELCKE